MTIPHDPESAQPDPPRRADTSPEQLKALAHPVRLRMLALLRLDGPQTATTLAHALTLNTGATSYHLRQLHAHGFVEDAPELGGGRDRYWRAAQPSTWVEPAELEPDVESGFLRAVHSTHAWQRDAALQEHADLPHTWRAASTVSDWTIRLRPDRARQLVEQVEELISGFADDPDESEDSEQYMIQLYGFPRPGVLGHHDEPPLDRPEPQ